jgi:DNA invertase Pin-like site-specific DNA recombinase
MATGKFVAYYRVSTQQQGASGLGLEAQRAAVSQYLDGGDWQLLREFTEIESGKRTDRPKLVEALKVCKRHKATLVIAKLDRLARNVAFISNLMESGVEFVAVDFPQANKLTVHILAAVAEYEADMISKRTREGLAQAKARGVRLGGRKSSPARFAEIAAIGQKAAVRAIIQKREEFERELRPVIEEVKASGARTYRDIAAELTRRGEPTARGGKWSPVHVMRILKSGQARQQQIKEVA